MTAPVKDEEFLEQIEKLPPLPGTVQQILTLTRNPTASANDVARVLSGDPAIVAKILRIANSPFYGARREVTQVSRAIVMLGAVAVRNLVIGICSHEALSPIAAQSPECTIIWRHSIAVASACDLIAKQVGYKPTEEAFLGGLLHDIGKLAIVTFRPEAFREVFADQVQEDWHLERERSRLGIDHAETGSRILTNWGIPEVLCYVVKQHHTNELDENDQHVRLLAIVIMGDILAHMLGIGFDISVGPSHRIASAAQCLNLSESDQLRILDNLENHIDKATEMLVSNDPVVVTSKRSASKRAIWVSENTNEQHNIAQLLLEHHEYELLCVSLEDLSGVLSSNDLVFLDLQQSGDAASSRLARVLLEQGFRKITILYDPSKDSDTQQRDLDRQAGICHAPRLFTLFDLHRIEEQLQP